MSIEPRYATAHKHTIQGLLGEALNDLFAKYGKPEIVPALGNTRKG